MEVVLSALVLIAGFLAFAWIEHTKVVPVKLHTDDCDICQEDMKRAQD